MPLQDPGALRGTVLVVDDEAGPRESLRIILAPHHRVLQAASGAEALAMLGREPVDLVTIDLNMPGMGGQELVRTVRSQYPELEVIVITGCGSVESAAEGVRYGIADYLQKPFDVVQVTAATVRALARRQARVRLAAFLAELGEVVGTEKATAEILADVQRCQSVHGRLAGLLEVRGGRIEAGDVDEQRTAEFLEVFAEAIEARDPGLRGHARRVALFAGLLAERLGLPAEEQEQIRIAAFLHDLGKIGVMPAEALLRPADADDRRRIEQHPGLGARLLQPLGMPAAVTRAVRHHHEWWDGTGYPDGLAEEEIPLAARIIGLVDAFDAMGCDRRYRQAMERERVIGELESFAGIQFDPALVKEFILLLESSDADAQIELVRDALSEAARGPHTARAAG